MENIIMLTALAIISVGCVEFGREIGRFIRLRKIKKARKNSAKVAKIKEKLADAVIKDRLSATCISFEDGKEIDISNEKPREWNSFTGYESEKEQINETLERR